MWLAQRDSMPNRSAWRFAGSTAILLLGSVEIAEARSIEPVGGTLAGNFSTLVAARAPTAVAADGSQAGRHLGAGKRVAAAAPAKRGGELTDVADDDADDAPAERTPTDKKEGEGETKSSGPFKVIIPGNGAPPVVVPPPAAAAAPATTKALSPAAASAPAAPAPAAAAPGAAPATSAAAAAPPAAPAAAAPSAAATAPSPAPATKASASPPKPVPPTAAKPQGPVRTIVEREPAPAKASPVPAAAEAPPSPAQPAADATRVVTDTCFAGCYTPTSAVARGRVHSSAAAPSAGAARAAGTPAAGTYECVAGCDGIANRPARASGSTTPAAPDTAANGRVTVLRGVTRAKVYGVGQ